MERLQNLPAKNWQREHWPVIRPEREGLRRNHEFVAVLPFSADATIATCSTSETPKRLASGSVTLSSQLSGFS
jgi:hypothetical protein